MKDNLVSKPALIYPAEARSSGVEGSVVLEAVINKAGEVVNVTVVSGHPVLVREAVENVRLRRYKTILLDGAPIDVVTTIVIDFSGR
jgi:protein TonB